MALSFISQKLKITPPLHRSRFNIRLSSRDINIIVSKSHPYHSIETILSSKKINYLEYFQLINTYEGPEVPKDAVSYTIRLVFQSNKKSLSEEEINGAIAKTLELLFLATGAKIRS